VTEVRKDETDGSPAAAVLYLVDVGFAGLTPAVAVVKATTRGLSALARPVRSVVLFPPLVPEALKPGRSLARLADRGARRRQDAQRDLGEALDRLVPAALDLVLRHVDLTRIVVEHVDLEAIVHRVDMATMATDIIATLDLPEIIRESTSAVSSETVRQVRMRGISADEAVGRAAHRLRPRRRTQPLTTTPPAAGELVYDGTRTSRSGTKDPPA